jgi:hypothetical protein
MNVPATIVSEAPSVTAADCLASAATATRNAGAHAERSFAEWRARARELPRTAERCFGCDWPMYAAARRADRAAARDERPCEGCGKPFTPARSDARYCSGACPQHAYRVRKATAS